VTHPFLVNLHYSFQSPTHLHYVIDYCPGGELYFRLIKEKTFPEERAKFYIAQIILALECLHQMNIIYRDVKLENVLICEDGYLKLTDFGLSKEGVTNENKTSTFCGTPEYLAPEVVIGKDYSEQVDWWGIGILIYEMLHGNAPFTSSDIQELFQRIISDEVVYPNAAFPSQPCKHIIDSLLIKEPEKRLIQPNLIKSHPWFTGFDWDGLYQKKLSPPYIPILKDKNCIGAYRLRIMFARTGDVLNKVWNHDFTKSIRGLWK
jgi:serine/threonine protein kinase